MFPLFLLKEGTFLWVTPARVLGFSWPGMQTHSRIDHGGKARQQFSDWPGLGHVINPRPQMESVPLELQELNGRKKKSNFMSKNDGA